MNKTKVVAIVGPTASGKTAFSIALAKELGGEIVSADSMQIYRGMDIGTAKPTAKERDGVPHHMIDIVDLKEEFSVAKYCAMAHTVIENIHARGNLPIVVGGTGLYVDALLNDITFGEVVGDESIRARLHELANEQGNGAVYALLEQEDPAAAERLHPNNLRRVIRAIEMKRLTGISILEHEAKSVEKQTRYDAVIFGMRMDREVLYDRINRRVDLMIELGLWDEVKVLQEYLRESKTSVQGLGYKELLQSLDGEISSDEAIEILKRDSRRYAKRQMTWFRRNPNILWIDAEQSVSDMIGIAKQTIGERWGINA